MKLDDRVLPLPLNLHNRTKHCLPPGSSQVQEILNEIDSYAKEHEMVINTEKTKVMLFNRSKNTDFMPELRIGDGELLEVVEEFKLLGVIIKSDLKWHSNTIYICRKGFSRLWLLRRLKQIGASEFELLYTYQKQVRSVLEYAVPVWGPGLNKTDSVEIERVQKCAFAIIFGPETYENILKEQKQQSLQERRINLGYLLPRRP